jgi:hypothetical protein
MRVKAQTHLRQKKCSTVFEATMAKDHFLVATDERFPVTVALDHAFATGQISPELAVLRKTELAELVSEAAKTFGFQAKTTLTNALDVSLGLLSLALAADSGGKTEPEKWATRIVDQSWKGLVKEAIGMSRNLKEKDESYEFLFESDRDTQILRELLREFALRRDHQNQWMGYKVFSDYRDGRKRCQMADGLVRQLIRDLVKRNLPWIGDPIDGPATADEALNTLLFREVTGLGFKKKDIFLSEAEFLTVRKQYDANPTTWKKQAQQRFRTVQDSLTSGHASSLDKNWFENHLKKGPPRLKSFELEHLDEIMGVYYYQSEF